MRIGEVARQAGVSVRMVRHYANCGLLPAHRDLNGYRDFAPDQVRRVRQVKALLDVGLTTAQVASIGGCLDGGERLPLCDAAQALLDEQLARIDERILELTRLRDQLADARTR